MQNSANLINEWNIIYSTNIAVKYKVLKTNQEKRQNVGQTDLSNDDDECCEI